MNKEILDILIIGAGPAGLTAAIYAKRANLKIRILEKLFPGGQTILTNHINNYPGFTEISGFDLTQRMLDTLKELEVEVTHYGAEKISEVEYFNEEKNINETILEIETVKEKIYAKFVIFATGASPRKLGLENEEKFTGNGVSYCATCDATFFKNETVAIVGSGNTATQDAILLSRIAKKVYIIVRGENLKAEQATIDAVNSIENIEVIFNTNIVKLNGDRSFENVNILNSKTNEEKVLEVDGVFVAIGTEPDTEVVKNLVELNEYNEIIVDDNKRTTNSRIYAAGDVTNNNVKQILTAMSDAVIAEKSIEKDLI